MKRNEEEGERAPGGPKPGGPPNDRHRDVNQNRTDMQAPDFLKHAMRDGDTWRLETIFGTFLGNPNALGRLGRYFLRIAGEDAQ